MIYDKCTENACLTIILSVHPRRTWENIQSFVISNEAQFGLSLLEAFNFFLDSNLNYLILM